MSGPSTTEMARLFLDLGTKSPLLIVLVALHRRLDNKQLQIRVNGLLSVSDRQSSPGTFLLTLLETLLVT
jgi:hypothetical protein